MSLAKLVREPTSLSSILLTNDQGAYLVPDDDIGRIRRIHVEVRWHDHQLSVGRDEVL